MLDKLPAWVVPNDVAVEREVAEYRDMPLAEKARIVEALARTLRQLYANRPDRDELYARRDPLPESSIRALQRLQKAGRASSR